MLDRARPSALLISSLLVSLLPTACSSSDQAETTDTETTGTFETDTAGSVDIGDTSTTFDGAGSTDGVLDGTSGGELPGDAPLSNMPQASFFPLVSEHGLQLVSSNFTQSPSGAEYFVQWYGEIENVGIDTVCLGSLMMSYLDEDGVQLAETFGYFSAAPYDTGLATSTDCLAPGERGGIYDNAFVSTVVDVDAVAEVSLEWGAIVNNDAIPHPSAPVLDSVEIEGGTWIEGDLRAANGSIHNVGLTFYVRDAQGLIIEELFDVNLGTVFEGDTWSFQTLSAAQPFESFIVSTSFIPGVG